MKSTNTDNSQKIAEILLQIGAVLFNRKGPFKFDSGILSPVYVDNRLIISYPKERKIIISALVSKIKNEIGIPDVIAGVATAGIPHAAWIAEELKLPMVFVRPKPKDHGLAKQVEGSLKKGQKVLIIEDLVSTAGSSVGVAKALRKLNAKVTDELAIYSHSLKESQTNFKKAKVKFHFLTSTIEVAKAAEKKEFLNAEQVETIREWVKDPKNWGKKMGFKSL